MGGLKAPKQFVFEKQKIEIVKLASYWFSAFLPLLLEFFFVDYHDDIICVGNFSSAIDVAHNEPLHSIPIH